jgi:hypothetical protein
MVPSWTETLVQSGVSVVGRTRYCVHPEQQVAAIPIVGGTKDVQWEQVRALKADCLLLDKEENPLWMAEQSPVNLAVTHIRCVEDVPLALQQLSTTFQSAQLLDLQQRWLKLPSVPNGTKSLERIPGIRHWIRSPSVPPAQFLYVIWRKPWMVVSRQTFIGSMFRQLGYGDHQIDFAEPYPKVDLSNYDSAEALLLFSTEPYDFARYQDQLSKEFQKASMALIQGDAFSWFGTRALLFLEQNLN